MRHHVHMRRAREVIQRAVSALENGEYPFQNINLPQDLLPLHIRNNPLTGSLVLFYSCHYMRGTIKSDYAMRKLVELYEARPDLFAPERAMQIPPRELQETLHAMIPYKSEEIARAWKTNSARLTWHWHGDPRTIFAVARSTTSLHRFVTNRATVRLADRRADTREDGFLGFQKKMASMLAYYLESCGYIEPFPEETLPPVDFHHLRVLIATRVIRLRGKTRARYEDLRPLGEYVYARMLREKAVRMRTLGDAIWLISNRLCSKSPATDTRAGEIVPIQWHIPEVVERYERTCGACPLRAWCVHAVQANTYYQRGHFELDRVRERAEKQPGLQLSFEGMPPVFPSRS